MLSLFVIFFNLYFPAHRVVDHDTFGYYLYLHQAFIAHDLEIKDRASVESLIQQHGLQTYLYHITQVENKNHVMKYSMGMAILYSPGFLVGHVLAGWMGYPQDGFSPPYMVALKIWCILVSMLGIWLLRRLLLRYVGDPVAAMVLVITLIGTHYIHNIAMKGNHTLSHNFLFTGYLLLIWLTRRWHAAPTLARILPIGLCAGSMILARPTELVCLFIPLLWDVRDKDSLVAKARLLARSWRQLLAFTGVMLLIALPQFIYWEWVTGKWLNSSYGGDAGEGFEWANPFLLEVLFGFRKGWFIYTPMALVGIAGLIFCYRRAPGLFWPIAAYLVVNLYLVSAWSCYWYANHFGQRALLPAMAVLALPMGVLLDALWRGRRRSTVIALNVVMGLVTVFLLLNIFQTYQFQKGIIDGVRMTKAAYFTGFTDLIYGNRERDSLMLPQRWHGYDRDPQYPGRFTRRPFFRQQFQDGDPGSSPHPARHPGAYRLFKGQATTPAIVFPRSQITPQVHAYVQAHARVRCARVDSGGKACTLSLVTHFMHNEQVYFYHSNPLSIERKGWQTLSLCQINAEMNMIHFCSTSAMKAMTPSMWTISKSICSNAGIETDAAIVPGRGMVWAARRGIGKPIPKKSVCHVVKLSATQAKFIPPTFSCSTANTISPRK
jgi:hypothetical protein